MKKAGMVVYLSEDEQKRAEAHARFVQEKSTKDGRPNRGGMDKQFSYEEQVKLGIMGYGGEIAAANFLGVPWEESVDTFNTKEDIPGWDVKTTTGNGLILRKANLAYPDRRVIVMKYLQRGRYRVLGWTTVHAAEKAGKWTDFGNKNRPKALYVDRNLLNKDF